MGAGGVTELRERISHALAPSGLNVVGVADPARWDACVPATRQCEALLPGTRGILVVGSGGPGLWDALVEECRLRPEALQAQAHPLDAFVRRAVEAVPVSGRHRWFFASADAELHLDFRMLAHLAGLGGKSRMGLLLHREHGLWLGLRAACFLDQPLAPDSPETSDPCAGCPGYCAQACPGGAFPAGEWQVEPCAEFHGVSTHCASSCDARGACPRGAGSRYSADELHYHYNRGTGRARLAAAAGVTHDTRVGEGPHWGTWRDRTRVR